MMVAIDNDPIFHADDPSPALRQFSLAGRTALVTGSSAGIGFALARGLAHIGVVADAAEAAGAPADYVDDLRIRPCRGIGPTPNSH